MEVGIEDVKNVKNQDTVNVDEQTDDNDDVGVDTVKELEIKEDGSEEETWGELSSQSGEDYEFIQDPRTDTKAKDDLVEMIASVSDSG